MRIIGLLSGLVLTTCAARAQQQAPSHLGPIGFSALSANTTGSQNTAVGSGMGIPPMSDPFLIQQGIADIEPDAMQNIAQIEQELKEQAIKIKYARNKADLERRIKLRKLDEELDELEQEARRIEGYWAAARMPSDRDLETWVGALKEIDARKMEIVEEQLELIIEARKAVTDVIQGVELEGLAEDVILNYAATLKDLDAAIKGLQEKLGLFAQEQAAEAIQSTEEISEDDPRYIWQMPMD